MITIPNQLSNQKFILLKDKNQPLQKKWQTVNNHVLDSDVFQSFLERNNNVYGVPTGHNNLIVIDFDDKATQDALAPLLPETFTVFSASKRLYHLYFFTDDVSNRYADEPGTDRRLMDIQGLGKYVVGPNSILPSGKSYDIAKDKPIATLYAAELNEILSLLKITLKQHEQSNRDKSIQSTDWEIFLNPTAVKIKQELKVSTLLQRFQIPIHKNPTKCPLGHESQSEKNFSFDDTRGLWHCFHCGQSGDVIHLYQYLYGLNNFKETKNKMFKDLFIKEQDYENALRNIDDEVRAKKNPAISNFEIDAIANVMISHFLFVTLKETDKVHYYDRHSGIYKNFGEQEIQLELEKYFTDLVKTNIVSEVINKIKRLTHKSVQVFNTHENLICMRNGVFNFETKLLLPHSPDYLFINSIPTIYNISSKCPKIDKFFKDIYPQNPELLYEICTFVLLKHNRHEKAVILVGTGRNGKSVYLSLTTSLIGVENVSSKSLQNLSEDKFATSGLFGKMANISSDIPSKKIADSSSFKGLVSGKDLIDAQFKGENSFKFVSNAKLLFSCNQLPSTNDQSDGFLRKWCILQFNQTFSGEKDNKFLLEEITDEDELSGLFNECIKRFDKVNIKGLDYTEDIEAVREMYNDLSDPLQSFLDEKTNYDGMSGIPFMEFYDKFTEFLTKRKSNPVTSNMLGRMLNNKKIKRHTSRTIKDNIATTQLEIFGYSWLDDNKKPDDYIDLGPTGQVPAKDI